MTRDVNSRAIFAKSERDASATRNFRARVAFALGFYQSVALASLSLFNIFCRARVAFAFHSLRESFANSRWRRSFFIFFATTIFLSIFHRF